VLAQTTLGNPHGPPNSVSFRIHDMHHCGNGTPGPDQKRRHQRNNILRRSTKGGKQETRRGEAIAGQTHKVYPQTHEIHPQIRLDWCPIAGPSLGAARWRSTSGVFTLQTWMRWRNRRAGDGRDEMSGALFDKKREHEHMRCCCSISYLKNLRGWSVYPGRGGGGGVCTRKNDPGQKIFLVRAEEFLGAGGVSFLSFGRYPSADQLPSRTLRGNKDAERSLVSAWCLLFLPATYIHIHTRTTDTTTDAFAMV